MWCLTAQAWTIGPVDSIIELQNEAQAGGNRAHVFTINHKIHPEIYCVGKLEIVQHKPS